MSRLWPWDIRKVTVLGVVISEFSSPGFSTWLVIHPLLTSRWETQIKRWMCSFNCKADINLSKLCCCVSMNLSVGDKVVSLGPGNGSQRNWSRARMSCIDANLFSAPGGSIITSSSSCCFLKFMMTFVLLGDSISWFFFFSSHCTSAH